MVCSDFNILLDKYENLSDSEKSDMDKHAEDCESCRGELEFFKSIILTTSSLPIIEPPADFLDKVNARIDNIPESTLRFDKVINGFRCNKRRYATAAACLAVGLVVSLNSKTINNMLNNHNSDGVIRTETGITDNSDNNKDAGGTSSKDYSEAKEKDALQEAVPAIAAPTAAPQAKPQVSKPQATTAPAASKPQATTAPAKSYSSQNASSVSVATAKPATSKSSASAPASNTTTPASAPAPARSSQTVSIPAAAPEVQEVQTQADTTPTQNAPEIVAQVPATEQVTEPTAIATEAPSGNSKYTIARDNYHIPTEDTAAASITEAPEVSLSDIPEEKYQIAMGTYQISESAKRAIRSALVVSAQDAKRVTELMDSSGIASTEEGYSATSESFNHLLAALDARGIEYTFAKGYSEGNIIDFILMSN